MTASMLACLLREAAEAHHQFELSTGQKDENWPDWYASYIVNKLPPVEDVLDWPNDGSVVDRRHQ